MIKYVSILVLGLIIGLTSINVIKITDNEPLSARGCEVSNKKENYCSIHCNGYGAFCQRNPGNNIWSCDVYVGDVFHHHSVLDTTAPVCN